MTKLSGTVLYFMKNYIIYKFANERFNEVLADLDEDLKEIMSNPILSSKCYDEGKCDILVCYGHNVKLLVK